MSSAGESQSLLPNSRGNSGSSSGSNSAQHVHSTSTHSAPGSKATTPSMRPSTQAIKLEDHRPGRRTTFSLLVGSPNTSPPGSPRGSGRSPIGYDSIGTSSTLTTSRSMPLGMTLSGSPPAGSPSHYSHQMSAINGVGPTPYRYGDGTQGYRILFPTPEESLDETAAADIEKHVTIAIWLSLIINILLFASKTFSAVVSHSLSVAASAVDSFLDLASQGIVFLAERGSKDHDSSLYPAGRSRLEPVGIILCAALMGMAALQLILESGSQLWEGYGKNAEHNHVAFDPFTLSLLVFTILAKLGLWLYCAAYAKYSPTLYALAVDHRNDVLSNSVALLAALLAWKWEQAWSADPIGAILMSIYICMNWFSIGNEQIEMIVGRAADPEFIASIRSLASNFHTQMTPDIIRAYHFGAKYLVELEVILPAEMTVREAHDISLALQQSIEQLPSVERAFVHVDYRARPGEDEHNAKLIAERVQAGTPKGAGV